MTDLPSVTLLCADCVDVVRAIVIMERCKAQCNFGAVKLLTSIPTSYEHRVEIEHLPSLIAYSIFMLKRAVEFVDTKHVLVVQHDGYIINGSEWDSEWLQYDYMGPLFIQEHKEDEKVGSGGFSLRTKKLMEFVKGRVPAWDGTKESTDKVQKYLGRYEDGVIAHWLRADLKNAGFKFAPPMEAAKFAQGGYPHWASADPYDRTYFFDRPFGFHGGWSTVNRETGLVSPPPFW